MKDILMAIENKLRFFRENSGISVAELERASGVSDRTIRKIETRKYKAKKTTKVKILLGLKKLAQQDFKYEEVYPQG